MKKEKIVQMVYNDTMDFMFSRDNWAKVKTEGSFIAFGILRAVFGVVFDLAPNKKEALSVISMALEEYTEEENEI